MKKEAYYQKLFLVAALWNWLAAIPFLFAYRPLLGLLGETVPEPPTYLRIMTFLIILFGWGFFMVYRNLANRDIVKMGAVGKLAIFLIALYSTIKGDIQLSSFVLLFTVDLVFAALFIEFLYRGPRN